MKTYTRMCPALLGISLFALVLAGCGPSAANPDAEVPDVPPFESISAATSNPQEITSVDFGSSWPLSVDRGSVGCRVNGEGDAVITFTAPDQTVYALNDVAENDDNAPINDVTKARGNMGSLRSFALTTCDVD